MAEKKKYAIVSQNLRQTCLPTQQYYRHVPHNKCAIPGFYVCVFKWVYAFKKGPFQNWCMCMVHQSISISCLLWFACSMLSCNMLPRTRKLRSKTFIRNVFLCHSTKKSIHVSIGNWSIPFRDYMAHVFK